MEGNENIAHRRNISGTTTVTNRTYILCLCFVFKKQDVRTGLTGSWSGIGHIHQGTRGLRQGLVVDCVGDCGRLLLLGLPEVVIRQ